MNFKKILPALTLLFALAIAFAFKPVHKANVNPPTGEIFQFIGNPGTGDEFDPLMYIDMTGAIDPHDDADCPGHEVLCAIATNQIYTQVDTPSSQYVGQPKVDQTTLINLIYYATTDQQDDVENGIFLRTDTTNSVNLITLPGDEFSR